MWTRAQVHRLQESRLTIRWKETRIRACLLWGGLDKSRYIVPNALLVRVQCFRTDMYNAEEGQAKDLSSSRWSLGHTFDDEGFDFIRSLRIWPSLGSAHQFYAAFELTRRLTKLDVICIFSNMLSISSHISENLSDPRLFKYTWIRHFMEYQS